MKLKTAPCLVLALGVLVAPSAALAAKPTSHAAKVPHRMHAMPVPNSHPNLKS